MRVQLPFLLIPGLVSLACSGAVGSPQDGPLISTDPDTSSTTSVTNPPPGVSGSPTSGASGNVPNPANTGAPTSTASSGGPIASSPIPEPSVETPPEPNPDGSLPAVMELQGAPIYTRFMRLTNAQWARSVQDLLKLDTAPSTLFFENPAELVKAFTNNESLLEVTPTQWANYETATEDLVKQVTATDAALAKVFTGTDGDAFIRTFGRRAFRRPLTDAEVAKYQAVFDTGSALSGSQTAFTKGAGLVIEAMLQSANFLYRSELGANGQPLNSFEVASKLSFWLLGRTPSDALLDKATSNGLDSAEQAASEATTMLQQPEAIAMYNEFQNELYQFKRFSDVSKTDPAYTGEAMNSELLAAAQAFFEHIFKDDLGVNEILTSTQGFVGPQLAPLYGVQAPAQLTLMDLGTDRKGYFSQVPYLLLFGSQAQANTILRGVHLLRDVLCAETGIPSAVVTLNPIEPNQTNRERVEATTGLNTCGGTCHGSSINPLGYAFEGFDGLGRSRTEDAGKPVDASSTFALPGETVSYSGAAELMQAIASNSMAHECYAKHIAGFGLQRDIVKADVPMLQTLASVSLEHGSVKNMIVELVKNPAFRVRNGGAQ